LTSRALICDTGALLDYLVASSPDHGACVQAIHSAPARYVPGLVLAELDYFLREERDAMHAFVADIRSGAFLYAPPTDEQLARAMVIDATYPEREVGLVDATIVALAEELDITRIATRDVRHFSALRLADGRPFDLAYLPGAPGAGKSGTGKGTARQR
jgi:predicted nucleic acid-binding protein